MLMRIYSSASITENPVLQAVVRCIKSHKLQVGFKISKNKKSAPQPNCSKGRYHLLKRITKAGRGRACTEIDQGVGRAIISCDEKMNVQKLLPVTVRAFCCADILCHVQPGN